jgi:lysophospholipase L1-like esterase
MAERRGGDEVTERPVARSTHGDDSQMARFERHGLRRFTARQAVAAVGLIAFVLVLFSGGSVRDAGEEMDPGIGRELVVAIGEPTGWVADRLPLQEAAVEATGGLSPDTDLSEEEGFAAADAVGAPGAVAPITADSFDPVELGVDMPKARLGTLLVTGDSLSTPLDLELARRLAGDGIEVERAPQLGTGISNDALVDWGQLSARLAGDTEPDATVVFIGANEGYPLPAAEGDVDCCGPEWAAVFAGRARQMLDNFRRGEEGKVYWLLVPTQRDPARGKITRAVNAAIEVAAQPWRDQVRLVDLPAVFTPEDRYRDSMEIDGEDTIVRESDGIHLNEAGSSLAADVVLEAIGRDFELP